MLLKIESFSSTFAFMDKHLPTKKILKFFDSSKLRMPLISPATDATAFRH